MNKYLKIVIPLLLAGACLAALLAGLGGMARAEPLAWTEAEPIPYTWFGNGIQCPDDPDNFYLVGGATAGGVNVDYVSRYGVITEFWESLAPLPFPIRAPALTCYQGKIYATHAVGNGGLLIYDIASDTWSSGASLPDTPAFAHLGTWDGKLYLAGGSTTGAPWVPENDVHVYDIASDTWTLNGATSMPVGATFGGSFQAGPYLYVVGGLSGDYDRNITVTQSYNMSTGMWELGPTFGSQRAATGLVRTEGYLYAIGGDANGGGGAGDGTDYVERLDLTVWPGGAWTDISDPLPDPVVSPGSFCTEALTGGEIWAVGGGFMIDNNLFRPAEACYDFYFGDLAPESLEGEGYRGVTVSYDLTLHNDGTLSDTFDISVSALWTTTAPAVVGPLLPGESAALSVTVDVPHGAAAGDMDMAQVSAASQGDPGMQDSAQITTTAITDWVEAAQMPEEVYGYGAAQCPDDPDSFYIFGGRDLIGYRDSAWRYDASTNDWESLANLRIPLWGTVANCYGGYIYLAGGRDSSGDATDFFSRYEIATDSYTPLVPLPRQISSGAGLGIWDGKLYLVGGQVFDIPDNQVDMYDIETGTWNPNAGQPMPFAVYSAGRNQTGPYLWLVGGWTGDFNNNLDVTQRYDMSSNTWSWQNNFTSRRAAFALDVTGSYLYALGGDQNGGNNFNPTDLVEFLDFKGWPDGQWIVLDDPLPQKIEGNKSGFCTETFSGGEIWMLGGINDQPPSVSDDNLYRPAEPCLGYSYSPLLVPEAQSGEGLTDTIVTYALTLTNAGDTPDAFDLTASSSWTVTLSGLTGALYAGESVTLTVDVHIPSEAKPYEMDTTTITVASQGDSSMIASAILTTTVLPEYGVQISPEADELSGFPGEMVAYSLVLSNTGNVTDTFDLTTSDNTWEVHLPVTTTALGAGEKAEVVVHITVPMDAMQGDMDLVTITASSQGDPGVQAMSMLTTTAVWYSNYLPVVRNQ